MSLPLQSWIHLTVLYINMASQQSSRPRSSQGGHKPSRNKPPRTSTNKTPEMHRSKTPSASSSKFLKRDIDCVSPDSPEMAPSKLQQALEDSLKPLYDELETINGSIQSVKDEVHSDFESLQSTVESFQQEMKRTTDSLHNRICALEQDNTNLKADQAVAQVKITTLTERVISLESHMRRDNLKFLNIKTSSSDNEDCEALVLALCRDMGINLDDRAIIRAHRTGPKTDNSQAIIVKFSHFKDKTTVLRAKQKFNEIGIWVVEDFPPEILERRKVFSPVLKAAFSSGGKYKARLVVDRLLLNGRFYRSDELTSLPMDLQPKDISTETKESITAFFTSRSPLSNHHPSEITINNQKFSTVEQFFMHQKAMFFKDTTSAVKILSTSSPKDAKTLGRSVKNFNISAWNEVCVDFMKTGLHAKFHQNDHLARFLKNTGDTKLVEANPRDKYWGVGLSLQDDKIWSPDNWAGKNTLGLLLEEIRKTL